MQKLSWLAWIAISVFFGLVPVSAAEDCLVSLDVDPGKTVTTLNLGASNSESIVLTMSCVAAEKMREEMFISGQAIDLDGLGKKSVIVENIKKLKAQLDSSRESLIAANSKAKRQAALKVAAGFGSAAGVVAGSAGCVAGGIPACFAAFGSAVALVALVDSAADSASDLKAQADAAAAEIQKLTPLLSEMQSHLDEAQTDQYKLRYNQLFTALCESIRAQCMR